MRTRGLALRNREAPTSGPHSNAPPGPPLPLAREGAVKQKRAVSLGIRVDLVSEGGAMEGGPAEGMLSAKSEDAWDLDLYDPADWAELADALAGAPGPSLAGGAAVSNEETEIPELVSLFLYYNDVYFGGALDRCVVEWSSPRMTLCAGQCGYDGAMCRIRLSEPLLKFRPVSDFKNTLLHEMIHAFIFLRRPGHTHEDHGPMFCSVMEGINTSTVPDHMRPKDGYHITVYHTFHDEVEHYRKHHWTCDRCTKVVRRAMNRPPSVADCFMRRVRRPQAGRGGRGRGQDGSQVGGSSVASETVCRHSSCLWHTHLRNCGGTFVKTAEPDPKPARERSSRKSGSSGAGKGKGKDIATYFKRTAPADDAPSSSSKPASASGPGWSRSAGSGELSQPRMDRERSGAQTEADSSLGVSSDVAAAEASRRRELAAAAAERRLQTMQATPGAATLPQSHQKLRGDAAASNTANEDDGELDVVILGTKRPSAIQSEFVRNTKPAKSQFEPERRNSDPRQRVPSHGHVLIDSSKQQ